jgi:hypothetical protein
MRPKVLKIELKSEFSNELLISLNFKVFISIVDVSEPNFSSFTQINFQEIPNSLHLSKKFASKVSEMSAAKKLLAALKPFQPLDFTGVLLSLARHFIPWKIISVGQLKSIRSSFRNEPAI